MSHLKIVRAELTPKAEVKRRVRKSAKPPAMVQCHRCGGREVIETRTGVMLKDGKATGGTKVLLCAHCYMGGERVALA